MTVLSKGLKISQVIANQYPELKEGYTIEIGVADGAKYPNGQSVADVAYWNEYGTTTITAHSFITATYLEHSDGWPHLLEQIFVQSGYKLDVTLEAFSNIVVGQVKNKINNIWEPPLSPYTIKRKGTDKPLIDTGLLMNSIAYQIEKK